MLRKSRDDRIPPSRFAMRHRFTLEYWRDGEWFVGRLIEVPGVFSQGKTLDELSENIQDAYQLMVTQDRPPAPSGAERLPVELEV
jgi:predicted RNase H-like HicB family nuclease